MRAIKFRAWDGKDMEYIEDLYWFEENGVREVPNASEAQGHFSRYALMQFTGLHDKNGREIYEGDIVRYKLKSLSMSWDAVREIKWRHGAYRHGNFTMGANMPGMLEGHEHQPFLEVVGNTHESPELLE